MDFYNPANILNPNNPISPLNPINPLNPNSLLNTGTSTGAKSCVPEANNNFCKMTDDESVLVLIFVLAVVAIFAWIFKIFIDA